MRWRILGLLMGLAAVGLVALYPNTDSSCFFLATATVTGTSMLPLIGAGEEITIAWDYYDCNPLLRGDIVAIDFAARKQPIIKRLVALPRDKVEIVGFILYVNDIAIKNSTDKTYTLTQKETDKINKYRADIKAGKDFYLVLSDNISNKYDSRLFGPVFRSQIKGRVLK